MITKRKGTITVTTRREFLSALKKQFSISKADNTHTIVYKTTANINLDSLCISGSDCHIQLCSNREITIKNLTIKYPSCGNVRFDCEHLFIDCIDADAGVDRLFDLDVNYDRIGFIDCVAPLNLSKYPPDKAKTVLKYMNSLMPIDSDVEIGENMQISIDNLIRLIGGQSAIDICDRLIIPSNELPVNENNEIILFKKCSIDKIGYANKIGYAIANKIGYAIVKLRVPITKDTEIVMLRNSDGYANKMRVSSAIVDSIYGIDSRTETIKKSTITQVRSLHDSSFLYVLGKTVSPKNKFDSSVTLQCSSGIYGFLNVISAINYV